MINFFSEDIQFPKFKKMPFKGWIKTIINGFNKKCGDLNFIFCSDDYILSINIKYLNHNYFTDIITFNYNENTTISGDIFISLDTVKANAELYKVDFENELKRVMVHGVLHLIGFNDSTDSEKLEMRNQENIALSQFPS